MSSTAAKWSNWSGYVSANPASLAEPSSVSDVQALVTSAPGPVRVRGSGHSFTPLVASTGTIVSLDRLAGLQGQDADLCQATVGAGTKLNDLTRIIAGIGQALANMGDIDKQSLGGVLGTATHGTGPNLGAYHTMVRRVELVDGRGQLRIYDKSADQEMMEAIGVTLGIFGILTSVTIQNVPSYRLHKRRSILPIGDMLASFETMMTAHRSAEFFFVPFSGHALFLASDITTDPVVVRPPEDDEDGLKTLKLLRDYLKWFPWARRKLIEGAMRKLPPEDFIEDWLKVYASDRQTRFNEMEYHLPVEEGPKALAEIIAMSEKHFPEVYFPIEVRVVAADDFWLSPFYKRPTCSIAVHHDAKEDPIPFQTAMEPIFRRYGGRPHWGKMHTLKAPDFEKLYPRFRDAMEIRREIDPDNRFVTPYLAGIIGL
jgi:FAD-linked oxidoreductase